MKMKLLGFPDSQVEEGMNAWLTENPSIQIDYVTAFPCGEGARWCQVMVFFSDKRWNFLGRSANPVACTEGQES
jgi:hypothetical protein